MSPTKDRQRATARARLEREMAARAEAAQRRRRTQASVAAGVTVLLLLLGGVWLWNSMGDDKGQPGAQPSSSAAAGCAWSPYPDPSASPAPSPAPPIKDVGMPPTSGEPRSGTQILTISTNLGDIKVKMNLAKSPCVAANFAFLASKDFYNDTKCHRAFPGMLQCGDPTAKGPGWRDTDGQGGPGYKFGDENLPADQRPAYPRGTMAMANSGPGTNGSQFFFISRDTSLNGPNYAVVGTIVEGLDLLDAVDKEGTDGGDAGEGHPKKEVVIKSVSVSAPQS